MKTIKIGTRKSILAMWQAKKVAGILQNNGYKTEIIGVVSKGDLLTTPLYEVGGKGLFCSALEEKLLNHTIDIAVHSVKDLSVVLDDRLPLKFTLNRDSHKDCLVSFSGDLMKLAQKSKIGTTSLRRRAELFHLRNDLEFVDLRGNLDTRLKKLKNKEVDAIVVSKSGLLRLGLYDSTYHFDLNITPCAGQGVIGIQTRLSEFDDLVFLNDEDTKICIELERSFVRALNASCNFPIGAYAYMDKNQICMRTMYADPKTFGKIDCFFCGESKEVLDKCIQSTKSKIKSI